MPKLPRSFSVPGLVKIWMPPKPGRSFSAESGLSLMRTSRIESREGMRPPSKPSMVICPPLGPAAGPARAWSAAASSSGSSGSASRSLPLRTMAPALAVSTLRGPSEATVTSSFSSETPSVTLGSSLRPAATSTSGFSKGEKPVEKTRTL